MLCVHILYTVHTVCMYIIYMCVILINCWWVHVCICTHAWYVLSKTYKWTSKCQIGTQFKTTNLSTDKQAHTVCWLPSGTHCTYSTHKIGTSHTVALTAPQSHWNQQWRVHNCLQQTSTEAVLGAMRNEIVCDATKYKDPLISLSHTPHTYTHTHN